MTLAYPFQKPGNETPPASKLFCVYRWLLALTGHQEDEFNERVKQGIHELKLQILEDDRLPENERDLLLRLAKVWE